MKVSAVAKEDAPSILAYFGRQIKKALRSGQGDAVTPQELLESVTEGRSQAWVAHDDEPRAVAVVAIRQFQAGRKVFVEFLAGEGMDGWVSDMESALIECRRKSESMCVEASCRPGLAKYLKRRGWRTKAVIMEAPNEQRRR